MGRSAQLILISALLVMVGLLFLKSCEVEDARKDKERAELDAGIAASRILESRFAEAGTLKTADLHGRARSTGTCKSGNLFNNQQRTVAPFSVNYFVDLTKVDRASLRWNATDKVMFVELPALTVENPNIDLSRAISEQDGVFVSRACGLSMQKEIAGRLSAVASKEANRPELLERARASARIRVANLIRASLAAAQVPAVDVRVRLVTDPRPSGDQVWDMSRSIEEVLADPVLK